MNLTLDYGRTGLSVTLPDRHVRHVLGLSPAPPLDDPAAEIARALDVPTGTEPLGALARGRSDACIVICDITRPVPNALIVAPMLARLADAGLPPTRVTILVATGTHRPSTDAEKREMLGDAILESGVRVVDHVCTDPATNRFLGVSPNGVPVALSTYWLDADLKITVGLIEPHFMAGYSGGRKLVMPGIAALESVQRWHSPQFLEHPNARNGVLDGNPVHEENTAIAAMAPADFLCDVTIDEKRRVTGVFAGHWQTAWRVGVDFVARQVLAPIPEAVDIAVTSAGGYPLDQTFYQVVKGIVGAFPIVRPGGSVIIAAGMNEGIGGPHFRDALAFHADLQETVRQMSRPDWAFIPEQWQAEELAKATREHTVIVVSDAVSAGDLRASHVVPAASVEAAVDAEIARLGPDATIAVIPKGPYVIPAIVPAV
jgi:nickel-dependent lactate racemase